MPEPTLFNVQIPTKTAGAKAATLDTVTASPASQPDNPIKFTSRIALAIPDANLKAAIKGRPLQVESSPAANVFILKAPDAWTALEQADELCSVDGVRVCYPAFRRKLGKHFRYAYKPNDPYFIYQWNMEHRGTNGAAAGVDLNVRAAWPYSKGDKVTIAIADDGIDMTHPELEHRLQGMPNFNFNNSRTNCEPGSKYANHGTAVAGLASAESDNHIGMSGVAPAAKLAGWVVFTTNDYMIDDSLLMNMYQYAQDTVDVQNHSWGNVSADQLEPTFLESIGLNRALNNGRSGLGTIMVRSAGNGRDSLLNANDNAYASDPRVIAVGAVRIDGRAASYSSPGACILVSAPSGDSGEGYDGLFTTDRQGQKGYNQITFTNDLADYAFNVYGFSGTSASAPQISGLVALILESNPSLSIRDVQQILIHSARQYDMDDPNLTTNAAGFRVSHNTGFGVPDAGFAVRLARNWPNRPPSVTRKITWAPGEPHPIPDNGITAEVRISNDPDNTMELLAVPGTGIQPDSPTPSFPLVYVGQATNEIGVNLTGKAALIKRGVNLFKDKINAAAEAGAEIAVIFNNRDNDVRVLMAETDYTTIPAAFISQQDGEMLEDMLLNQINLDLRLSMKSEKTSFTVTNSILCEHVGVRIKTDHERRGDLRITLTSPKGTTSILQNFNPDDGMGPLDWTYYSTHSFYENSLGTWTLAVTDEIITNTGNLESAEIIIHGTPINDEDTDGLDDQWEQNQFGNLDFTATDDNDLDGFSNIREYIMNTPPVSENEEFKLDISQWNTDYIRLSWPSSTHYSYELLSSRKTASPAQTNTNINGRFPETELFLTNPTNRTTFFKLRRTTR
ncbi:MAG: S8 family serine peptidase [Verrucomicrobia bacterium]|nr:S8 family serine peptidase [Verrucomicrobiota bacterium]